MSCFVQTCDQIITGRQFAYDRALEIIQDEEYLDDADFDEIRRYDIVKKVGELENPSFNIPEANQQKPWQFIDSAPPRTTQNYKNNRQSYKYKKSFGPNIASAYDKVLNREKRYSSLSLETPSITFSSSNYLEWDPDRYDRHDKILSRKKRCAPSPPSICCDPTFTYTISCSSSLETPKISFSSSNSTATPAPSALDGFAQAAGALGAGMGMGMMMMGDLGFQEGGGTVPVAAANQPTNTLIQTLALSLALVPIGLSAVAVFPPFETPRTIPAVGVIFTEARDMAGTVRKRDVRRIYREIEKRSLPKFWIGDSTVELPSYWELKDALGNAETRKVGVLTKVWNGLARFRVWIAKRMYKRLPKPLKKIVKKIGRIEARIHKIVVCMRPRLKRRYGTLVYPEGLTVRALKNKKESFFDFIKNGDAETEDVQYIEDCFADMERPKFGWRVRVSFKEDEPCNLDLDNPESSTCILTSGNNNDLLGGLRNAGLANPVAQSRQTGEQFRSAAPPDCRYRYICDENNQAQGNAGDTTQPIDDQANLATFETNQVQANPAPAILADATPVQFPENPAQANNMQANIDPFETDQVQANPAPSILSDAAPVQIPEAPAQPNNVQANIAPFEGNQATRTNTVQAPPTDANAVQLPVQENQAPTLPENPSTVLEILAPQPPVPVQTNTRDQTILGSPVRTNPVLSQPEDAEIVTAPEAPQQVLGPQDFYSSSQDPLDVYKYYPYTTVRRT